MKIVIIGAGIAGLTAAHSLNDKHEVHVFEKARGGGGRMSTRYADPYQFDHGAQFFTARSPEFQDFLKPFIAGGQVAEWTPRVTTLEVGQKPYKRDWFEPHYVATPKMNSLCQALSRGVRTHIQTRIGKLEKHDGKWVLYDENGQMIDSFDWVISSMPQPQLVDLFPSNFVGMDAIRDVKMTGCFTMMVGFETPPPLLWDAAVVVNSPIEWMAVNTSKPDRETGFSMVINTTNEWAESRIVEDASDIQGIMLRELSALLGDDFQTPDFVTTHKWRFANVAKPMVDAPYMIDRSLNLAACGDWFVGGRVESAFQSAHALCKAI